MDNLLNQETIQIPITKKIKASIEIPGSKSITNRALLLGFLATGTSKIENCLISEDTNIILDFFKQIGTNYKKKNNSIIIKGESGKIPIYEKKINVENAGTAARFLTSILALGKGNYLLDGNQRMRLRPIYDLVKALQENGVNIQYKYENGYLPIVINSNGLKGGEINIFSENSSQFISSILIAAPYAKKSITINTDGKVVSKPYVDMTISMMEKFQAKVEKKGNYKIKISNNNKYQAQEYIVEADYSSASYFIALPLICEGKINITNLVEKSIQGDSYMLQIAEKMGAKVRNKSNGLQIESSGEIESLGTIDLNSYSDLVPTVAVLAVFANGVTKITNVANMRIKESDRILALVTELSKIGVEIEEYHDGLKIYGCNNNTNKLKAAKLSTYNDHRLAMSFSLLGLRIKGLEIKNPNCVAKTFPNFYQKLFKVVSG